jgi:hypothetical protein
MKKLILILIIISLLSTVSCTASRANKAVREPAFNAQEVESIVLQELVDMSPPIADISYYRRYQWQLISNETREISYNGNGQWDVLSIATFDGFNKGLSVGTNRCALCWHFDEVTGTIELVDNELFLPEGTPPALSHAEVVEIVAENIYDIYSGDPKLNWHDSSHWKADYLGDNQWEVRLIITNAVGVWQFDEKTSAVEFVERLGPLDES